MKVADSTTSLRPAPGSPLETVVIGAGQGGLSAAHHLARRGLAPWSGFVVLDADTGPGGAWAHRTPSLTMRDVNGLHPLPGMPAPEYSASAPARDVVPAYFAAYEREFALPVIRPVRVAAVTDGPGPLLTVRAADGLSWTTRTVVSATGTWTRPFIPHYPGAERFRGRQLHSADYRGPESFAGPGVPPDEVWGRVLVVGGGLSAIQILAELGASAAGAETVWTTRTPPRFRPEHGEFTAADGRAAVALVEQRVRAGLPPQPVVAVTGLPLTSYLRRARELGVLERRVMFDHLTEDSAVWADGHRERIDAVVWATGFRPAIGHLAPLGLRGPGGGIRLDGDGDTRAAADHRVHLIGYGPSASTIGADRAGRAAAVGVLRGLLPRPTADPAARRKAVHPLPGRPAERRPAPRAPGAPTPLVAEPAVDPATGHTAGATHAAASAAPPPLAARPASAP
jgi:cation diffusion facilitator CzcD-associated flavoprotein CzcO